MLNSVTWSEHFVVYTDAIDDLNLENEKIKCSIEPFLVRKTE